MAQGYCSKCGRQTSDQDNFCPSCGIQMMSSPGAPKSTAARIFVWAKKNPLMAFMAFGAFILFFRFMFLDGLDFSSKDQVKPEAAAQSTPAATPTEAAAPVSSPPDVSDLPGVKVGDKVTIITPGALARLCPRPSCGQDEHLARIPRGVVLEVEGVTDVTTGMASATWFEVTFKGKRGWVSAYDTDKAP